MGKLINDEVNANNELISITLDLMCDSREKVCKEVNNKFNLNIQVKKGVEEIEPIHDNSRGIDRE